MAVYGDGDVRVCFSGGYTWTFNPACLSAEDDTIVDLDPHQKTDSYSNNSYVEVLQVCCYTALAIIFLIRFHESCTYFKFSLDLKHSNGFHKTLFWGLGAFRGVFEWRYGSACSWVQLVKSAGS